MIKINTVYIDILFGVNFAINISLILCTGYITKRKSGNLRLFASAGIGALYSCFIFIFNIDALFSLGMRIAVACLMMVTAFGTCRIIPFAKLVLSFLGTTLALGMLMLSVLYFSPVGIRLGGVIRNGVFYFHIPIRYMLLCSGGVYVLIYLGEKLIKKSSARSFARVTVKRLDKIVELRALIDTGNMLKDPISGKKVLIAEADKLSPLFDFDIENIFSDDTLPDVLPEGFRLIPFSSIGKQNGMMMAFVPDTVTVESSPQNDIITAVFNGSLSQSGDYDALIAPLSTRESNPAWF